MRDNSGRLATPTALLTVAAVLGAAGLVARRYSPDPSHPSIALWYEEIDKPAYKPPDPLFGAIWPVLQVLHSYGAFRLLRSRRTADRNVALALWLADIGIVSGWAKLFFGERSLTGAAWASAALVLSATGFIERASRVDAVAAVSAVPFALWSVFGGVMTEDLRERNPRLDRGSTR